MASNDNVIDLLDDSSGDERGGAPAAAAAAPAPAATSPARRRRKRRRRVESSGDPANNNAGVAAVLAPNANVFEIDDDSDDGGNDNNGRAGGNDDSVEILSPPAAAAAAAAAPAGGGAAARSPGSSSDGSFIEVISPFTAARQERMNTKSKMENDYDTKPAAASAAASSSKPPADDTPLHRIISIFPDICPRHAREQLRQVGLNPTRIDATDTITTAEEQMISVALSNLVEGGPYPKVDGGGGSGRGAMAGGLLVASKTRSYLHDYSSLSSFTPSDTYKDEVVERLMVAFCFLSKEGVKRHLAEAKGRYSICYTRICDAIAGVDGFAFGTYGNNKKKAAAASAAATSLEDDPIAEEKAHKRLRAVRAGCALSSIEIGRLRIPAPSGFTSTLRRSRRNYRPVEATDRVLLDEVRYASDKLAERADVVAAAAERQRIHDASEKAGTTLECLCCYGDCKCLGSFSSLSLRRYMSHNVFFTALSSLDDITEMVACREEGHLFCTDCLRRYAEERVFGVGDLGGGGGSKKSADGDEDGAAAPETNDLTCFHADGCTSTFQYELLQKALPPKVMQKYDELQATRAMEIAGVEGLHRCPKCDFQAQLSPSEMIFHCPVESCRFESCKLCGEPSHIPLKCSEVEKQNETDGRKKVEEAMSEARIRTCPKAGCGNRFYKVDGCNKMTCPKRGCGTWSCYICRALIEKSVGYQHFCQTPHCNHKTCNKCPLYSSSEQDDIRATKEAGQKAAKEVSGGGEGVNVDVESLLKNADKSPRTNRHPPMPPPPAAAAAAGAYAGLPPPGLAVPYYPAGFPAGIAGVPAAVLYGGMGPYGGVAGPPPPRMGGGGGGGRRRRRRR